MIYITSDPHGDYQYIIDFCKKEKTNYSDIMFILGDVELNLEDKIENTKRKGILSSAPITFICIHGNHEKRPSTIGTYEYIQKYHSRLLYEHTFPNLLFALDGELYYIQGKTFLIIGGAFSPGRLLAMHDGIFYDDEQPDEKVFTKIQRLKRDKVDYVLTHTTPFNYIPYDDCTLSIDQNKVDHKTEKKLQEIYDCIQFTHWYCGHYHTNKTIDKLTFVYKRILSLNNL